MLKIIRNTLFTMIAIALTGLGLSWNKESVDGRRPMLERDSVVSAEKSSKLDVDIPLTVMFSRSVVKVNQYQEVTIQTQAGADLEIITAYPNGSINNPQTIRATADVNGKYVLKYKLDNQAYLGVFTTTVNASLGGRSATRTQKFIFQKWGVKETPLPDDSSATYYYPLIP